MRPLRGPTIRGELKLMDIPLPRCYLGYTRDRDRKRVLRSHLRRALWVYGYSRQSLNSGGPVDIQSYCERYNERVILEVFETVKRWFNELLLGIQRPGWTRGHYPPTAPPAPIEIIGALGEGVAGFIMERYMGFNLLYRPLERPDAILIRLRPSYEIGLMEVKTTVRPPRNQDIGPISGLESNLTNAIIRASIELIDFWAKIYHITGGLPYVGYPVGIAIKDIRTIRGQDELLVEAAVGRLILQ